jgi:hypothetical protein
MLAQTRKDLRPVLNRLQIWRKRDHQQSAIAHAIYGWTSTDVHQLIGKSYGCDIALLQGYRARLESDPKAWSDSGSRLAQDKYLITSTRRNVWDVQPKAIGADKLCP